MGKGVKPAFLYWDKEQLGYIDARLRVYFPLYRDAVAKTEGFAQLQKMAVAGPVSLWDFDGYDHEAFGMSLLDVFLNPDRPMGHAFVLKAMLLYGPEVTFGQLRNTETTRPLLQEHSLTPPRGVSMKLF